MNKLIVGLSALFALAACEKSNVDDQSITQDMTTTKAEAGFDAAIAKDNLVFSKQQYLKMLDNIDHNNQLHLAKQCETDASIVCYPRAREHDAIFIERPKAWTNGFYPGVFWKLLTSDQIVDVLTDEEESRLKAQALSYQRALAPEALRGSTHDLGFILYDSFGEALEYDGLNASDRESFESILRQGRETLIQRYSSELGVIKSWDFFPSFRLLPQEDGETKNIRLPISAPWSYPVIVDNMMNLEFLLSEENQSYHDIAYSHANQTMQHHYFYEESDNKQERPISYHLIDYDTMRPGNWQGMGAVSAWARGQAWSYYGFVTVLEKLHEVNGHSNNEQAKAFTQHLDRLFATLSHLLEDDAVPMWDFFADRNNGHEIAKNMDPSTHAYSRILDLCPSLLDNTVLPYKGYRPILIDKTMVTAQALETIESSVPINGGSFIVDDKISPCGNEEYDLSGRQIPKDTSAAAIIAAGLYRYAQFSEDNTKQQNLVALADKIMLELTNTYRSDNDDSDNKVSLDLGFALTQATGNLPSASEIDTSIVYGDFYFIEANIRKLQLENTQ